MLDDDEERHDTLQSSLNSETYLGAGLELGDIPALPRDSYASFLHGLLDRTEIWLSDDAEIDRSAEYPRSMCSEPPWPTRPRCNRFTQIYIRACLADLDRRSCGRQHIRRSAADARSSSSASARRGTLPGDGPKASPRNIRQRTFITHDLSWSVLSAIAFTLSLCSWFGTTLILNSDRNVVLVTLAIVGAFLFGIGWIAGWPARP